MNAADFNMLKIMIGFTSDLILLFLNVGGIYFTNVVIFIAKTVKLNATVFFLICILVCQK